MKYTIALLIANASAVTKHSPMYNQKLLEFATGMNGDEDLG